MNSGINPLLLVTFFPLVGVLLILLYKKTWKSAIRWTALITSLVTFGLSLWCFPNRWGNPTYRWSQSPEVQPGRESNWLPWAWTASAS
jgi:NADH:ubiquinone oxidoreductase subunit 4 (subunit M)